jgi:hypothetical protein
MKLVTFLAGAGLALTVSALPPVAFAQAPASTAGTTSSSISSSNPAGENNPNTSINASATASTDTGASNEAAPQDKAQQVKSDLDAAREQGKDVSTARHQYRLGMLDMKKGDNSKALQHFDEAENDIGTQQSNMGTNATGADTAPSSNPASGSSNNMPSGNTSNNY